MTKPLDIGKRINTLRIEKGLSRERFCGDESQLTVRQLARIEAGESLPSLAKLTFIAHTLDMPLSHLVAEEVTSLPATYTKLKRRLIRFSLYGDKGRAKEREDIFDTIYECYYEQLPEEEQLAIAILQAAFDTHATESKAFAQGLLEDYLAQVLQKNCYSSNDLLVIYLYQLTCFVDGEMDPKIMARLSSLLLEQENNTSLEYTALLQRNVINLISFKLLVSDFQGLRPLLDGLHAMLAQVQDYHFKPLLAMLEAKYCLFYLNNRQEADSWYQKAILGAAFLEDEILQEKLRQESQQDLTRFDARS